MTENEQIEEMAKVLEFACENMDCAKPINCDLCQAKQLYSKGYRKVERGEWIYQEYSMGHHVGKCTVCECEADMTNFCPFCGADMRGTEK